MFLTRTGIKKLMNRSYGGGGLSVRNDGKGIAVSGSTWAAYFLEGEIPWGTKGDLIALIGELPGKYEAFVATKGGNQMEVFPETRISAMDAVQAQGSALRGYLKVTPLMFRSYPRILVVAQDMATQDITLVEADKAAIVQPSLVDTDDDETLPAGPYRYAGMIEDRFQGVCWGNNRMAYAIPWIYPQEGFKKELLGTLEAYQLWEE